ncbi:MAG: hypothetical protein ACKPKO_44245, partial [Candidatus Fonsibacter sp.]
QTQYVTSFQEQSMKQGPVDNYEALCVVVMASVARPFFARTEMASSCTNPRKDALRKHQACRQHQTSVLEELGVQVGPSGNPLVGALPLDVFS